MLSTRNAARNAGRGVAYHISTAKRGDTSKIRSSTVVGFCLREKPVDPPSDFRKCWRTVSVPWMRSIDGWGSIWVAWGTSQGDRVMVDVKEASLFVRDYAIEEVPMLRVRIWRSLGPTILALVVPIATACVGSPESRARRQAVEHCETAVRVAARTRTRQEALGLYASHCSPLYGQPQCRAAISNISAESANPFAAPLLSCLKEYCPTLPGDRVAACLSGNLTAPEAVNRAWLDLSGAIFEREGDSDEVRLGFVLLNFVTDLNTRKPRRWPVDEKQAADAIARCEQGIYRALTLATRREMRRSYYESCASVYLEPGCRAAFMKAATSEPEQQLAIVTLACREDYCRWIPGADLQACSPDFVPSASVLQQAWPELNSAILKLEARNHVPTLTRAMLRLLSGVSSRPPD